MYIFCLGLVNYTLYRHYAFNLVDIKSLFY